MKGRPKGSKNKKKIVQEEKAPEQLNPQILESQKAIEKTISQEAGSVQ